MGVYIKGMEMPTGCARCPMLEGDRLDGLCHAASRWLDDDEYWTWYVYPEGDIDDSKPCNCPLIELPPHGRLIDADAFTNKHFDKAYFDMVNMGDKLTLNIALTNIPIVLNNAPTILEAEVEE